MNQKFRAWIKTEKCFADYIEAIRYYAKEIDLCWGVICESDCFNFEDIIFNQSTNTKDKTGKEIFEGDVLQIDYIKAIVRFGQYRYYDNAGKDVLTGNGFYLECLNVMDPDCISPYETDVLDKAEIIGNIYENHEYDQNFVGVRIERKK